MLLNELEQKNSIRLFLIPKNPNKNKNIIKRTQFFGAKNSIHLFLIPNKRKVPLKKVNLISITLGYLQESPGYHHKVQQKTGNFFHCGSSLWVIT